MEKIPGGQQHFLDITAYVCPMTFVRARLALERLASGERLEILLNEGEPLENLPRSLAELGHRVVSLVPANAVGTHRLTVERG